ncbi:hypothetical protein GPECTOR_7g1227 [Gonium pectorale]|uniref:Uncharacterized protein n=1 Tax=Gonium pectorale TaxID=33097 RepID=A0A150GUB2_GONPE|nr:hypothetical protein GPECTOR_7g1227 [Gonium pectorale]|eukprot:KXZ53333.1 hypothetical protein GPECTOR_7g1227 [Gonium pectorale]
MLRLAGVASLLLMTAHLPARAGALATTLLGTFYDVDFVSAGVGSFFFQSYRPANPRTLRLSGITGPVSAAYLYWHSDEFDTSVSTDITVNQGPVQGQVLSADGGCYNYTRTLSYRADVTDLVQAVGNGNYTITMPSNRARGASLLVIFDDGDPANNVDVVVYDGNDFNDNGWQLVTVGPVNYVSGTVRVQLHVADGQFRLNDMAVYIGDSVNPFLPSCVNTSFFGAIDGFIDAFWDIRTFDITSYVAMSATHS